MVVASCQSVGGNYLVGRVSFGMMEKFYQKIVVIVAQHDKSIKCP